MATKIITLIRDNIVVNDFVYRIDAILTLDETKADELIANGDAILFVEPVLPDPSDCDCHPQLHSITSLADHDYADVADYDKILHANDTDGHPEWVDMPTFEEVDTLQSVTDRGATTDNTITVPAIEITDGAVIGKILKCIGVNGESEWSIYSSGDIYKGVWDADTNTPELHDDPVLLPASAVAGWWYRVVVAGTQDLGSGNITFDIGDDVAFNGTIWELRPGNGNMTYVVEDETTDETCFILFNNDATGALTPKTNEDLTYDSSIGLLTSKLLALTDYVASVKLKVNLNIEAGLSSRNIADQSIVQFGNNLRAAYTGTVDTNYAGAMVRLDTRNSSGGTAYANAYTVFQIQTREANEIEDNRTVPFQLCPAPTGAFIMRRSGLVELNNGLSTPITIISTLADGTKPLTVTSKTMCDNLNADLLDGYHYTHFAVSTHTHAYLPLAGGTMNINAGIVFVGSESGTDTITMDWAEHSFELVYYSTLLNASFNALSADYNGNTFLGNLFSVFVDINGKLNTSAFKLSTGAGAGKYLQSDGSGNASWVSVSPGGTTTYIDLTDTDDTDYVGKVGYVPMVNAGADGLILTELPASASSYIDLTDTSDANYTGKDEYVPMVNEANLELDLTETVEPTFLMLTDVPASYSGAGGKFVKVNSGADGLEFATTAEVITALGWVDDISFEFRDITAGTAQTYDLDIYASYGYTIESASLETDNGTLTGVAIKIGGTSVTSLSNVTVDTAVDTTSSSGAKTVVAGDRVTLVTSTGYTGTPTLIRGKITIKRT